MDSEAMTAEQFATKLGEDLAHLLGWLECTATAVDSTGGGCTATRVDFTDGARTCSLVLVDENLGALDGETVARMYEGDAHRDGEWVGVAVYNGNDWREMGTDYTGTDQMKDQPIKDYALLVNHCADVLRDWERFTR
jgi:hypothetical protein